MKKLRSLVLILICFVSFDIIAAPSKPLTIDERNAGLYPYTLLELTKWDKEYEIQREKDIDIIFTNIDQKALIRGLDDKSRMKVILTIKQSILKQLIQDRDFFKKELVKLYSEFFTADELAVLVNYYRTKMMQMIISKRLENKPINQVDITNELENLSDKDSQAIKSYRNSYIKSRFKRFQEKAGPIIGELVSNRIKQIFDEIFKELPKTIEFYKMHPAS